MYPIGWRAKNIELYSIADKTQQEHCLFVVGADSIKEILLDDKAGVRRTFTMSRFRNEKLIGGFMRDGRVYACTYNETDTGFHVWGFGSDNGEPVQNYVPMNLEKEKEVGRIGGGDHVMYLTINKKQKEFILYDFRDEKGFDTLHYHFDDAVWQELTETNGNFGHDVHAKTVDPAGENTIDVAQSPNKLYFVRDTLYLLTNSEKGVTGIFTFDIRHKQVTFRQIRHNDRNDQIASTESYNDNSFLLNGKLYFVAVKPDSLCLQVHDFYSGQLLAQYAAGRNEDISFKNSPIIQEGGDYDAKATKELDKTRQLVRKMLNGRAVVVATPDSADRVSLSIGSYNQVYSGAGTLLPGAGGGRPIFMGGGFSPSWAKSAHFRVLLDERTSKHLDGEAASGVNERIHQYTKAMEIPSEAEDLFVQGDHYVYSYYDKKERGVVLVRF